MEYMAGSQQQGRLRLKGPEAEQQHALPAIEQ